MGVGQNLKYFRLKAGKTHQQVADYLNISRQAYTRYENDQRQIGIEALEKLAELYGYTVDIFLADNFDKEIAVTKSLLIELVNTSVETLTIMNTIDEELLNKKSNKVNFLLEQLRENYNSILRTEHNLNEFF